MRESLNAFEQLLAEFASEILLYTDKHKMREMDLDQYVPWLESTNAKLKEIRESIEDLLEKDLAGAWDLWVGFIECELSMEETLRSSRPGGCLIIHMSPHPLTWYKPKMPFGMPFAPTWRPKTLKFDSSTATYKGELA